MLVRGPIAPWLSLSQEIVPSAAFSPFITEPEQQRQALRTRMYNPVVQWQTFYNPTMGCHVRMPSGLALDATLMNMSSNATLGFIVVFRQSRCEAGVRVRSWRH